MKCDVCGAPVENGVCTYCGKKFPMPSNAQPPISTGNTGGYNPYPNPQNGAQNPFPQASGQPGMPNPVPARPPVQYQSSTPTWLCVLLLIIFFPVGLVLMWKYKKFNLVARIIITAIFALAFIGSMVQNASSQSEDGENSSLISSQSLIVSAEDTDKEDMIFSIEEQAQYVVDNVKAACL